MAEEARKKEWRNKENCEALQASKATMLQQEARLLWEQDAVSGFKRKPERKIKYHRGVAQLVARLLWEQDAGGSSPSTPTKNTRRSSERFVFFI